VQVGFLGLGAMGVGMARNLHRAGLLYGVYNRTRSKADELAKELGCKVGSPGELARECTVLVSCVSADADVLALVDEVRASARPGLLVIDCSTVSAATAVEANRRLSGAGARFLDAPVSGGVEGARDGTLAIMVGGEDSAFAEARPVLEALGKSVTHMGPVGAGQATKATNQIMCAGIIQAVAEAMAFAKAEGLPLPKVIEALSKGAGSSWYFVHRAPNIVRGSYPAGFRVKLHQKDLKICQAMSARRGAKLSVVDSTLAEYQTLVATGHGDEDISTLFRLKDALFHKGGG
jgi:3-hydroxyisobutyrate dehydrogenase